MRSVREEEERKKEEEGYNNTDGVVWGIDGLKQEGKPHQSTDKRIFSAFGK
jgi:hypothetical protein